MLIGEHIMVESAYDMTVTLCKIFHCINEEGTDYE